MTKPLSQTLELTLLTLNTMGAPFKGRRAVRYQKIAAEIRSSQAEFFALQETFDTAHTQSLILDPMKDRDFFVVHARQRHVWQLKTASSGLASLSRHPIIKEEFHRFKTARSVDRLANKGVLLTRLLLNSATEVDIYNTHLQASYLYRHQNAKTRMRQLEELASFVKTHSDPQNPVVILGDFNFKEDTPEYRHFLQNLWAGTNFCFLEVMRAIHPCEKTKPLFTFQMTRKKSLQEKLDHKFLHSGANWLWQTDKSSTEILDWGVSDHFAVLTKLIFTRLEKTQK